MAINSTDGKTDAETWPAGGLEKVPRCPVCGSERRELLHQGLRDRVFRCAPGQWDLQLCGGCGSGYLDPRPTPETIGLAYTRYWTHKPAGGVDYAKASWWRRFRIAQRNGYLNAQYGYQLKPATGNPRWLSGKRRQRFDAFTGYLNFPGPGARVLDVGCGNGSFLWQMRSLGWEVCGIEPDPKAVELARAAGFDVRPGLLPQISLPDAHFDAVVLSHVIEHQHDPMDTLRRCWKLLKPGGRISIATPNFDSIGRHHFGADWFALMPPTHLVLFTEKSLRGALEEIGFVVMRPPRASLKADGYFRQSFVLRHGGDPMVKKSELPRATLREFSRLVAAADKAAQRDPARAEELILLGRKPV
jgi:2-polyprenyl-3-methyl-5-hydroxy-6-metoxy-1,4-benzoquinol methylase